MLRVQANGNISLVMVIVENNINLLLLILFNYLIGKNTQDFTYVTNVAHAHILAADKLIPGSAIAGILFVSTLYLSLFIFHALLSHSN
jgi:3-beta hydroxysteroid dehydrogenase/isomerase family